MAFDLDNEEISDVFAADGGYYILKCLNTYLPDESEANKEKVARQEKQTRFQAIYDELMADTLSLIHILSFLRRASFWKTPVKE